MDQIREQLFAGAGFAFDQNCGLRVGHTQRELDCATYRGRLSDNSFLAVTFVQRAAKVHDLRRQLITLECGADLIGDAFDERHLVIVKAFSRLAPDESE